MSIFDPKDGPLKHKFSSKSSFFQKLAKKVWPWTNFLSWSYEGQQNFQFATERSNSWPLKGVLYSILGPDLLGLTGAVWNIVGVLLPICAFKVLSMPSLNHIIRYYNTDFWSNWTYHCGIRALNVNFSIFCALLYRTSLISVAPISNLDSPSVPLNPEQISD